MTNQPNHIGDANKMVEPEQPEIPNPCRQMIGRKVLLCGEHPWATHSGTVDRWEKTPFGIRPVVKLADGQECFVMKPEEWRLL